VAVLSTGDELIELGETLGSGKEINSNAYSLAASIKEAVLGVALEGKRDQAFL
jgi:molybdopterin molybdotransferase